MNPVVQNDDTHNDNDDAVPAPQATRKLAIVGAAALALLVGWGIRNYTAENAAQPLPMGPITENRADRSSDFAPPAEPTPQAESSSGQAEAAAQGTVFVHVAGHVNSPGVYQLPADARVTDAIARAGGVSYDGDGNAINQAARVQDGQKIEIPAKLAQMDSPASSPALSGPAAPSLTPGKRSPVDLAQNPVNLNTASAQELGALPGVGPLFAARIIAYREQKGGFRSTAELGNVPGIGDKRINQLLPYVTVG